VVIASVDLSHGAVWLPLCEYSIAPIRLGVARCRLPPGGLVTRPYRNATSLWTFTPRIGGRGAAPTSAHRIARQKADHRWL
jgi:hypothetical protein